MNFPERSTLSSAAALLVWWTTLLHCGPVCAAGPYCQEEIGDSGYCSMCPDGYWGRQCQNTCHSDKCMLNTCEIGTGYCTYGYMDGYYFDESERVCKQCPDRCTKCKSPTNCTECIDGYKGLQCQDNCLDRDYHYCAKCSRFDCTECVKGLFGQICMYNCSYCRDGCDRLKCIGGCLSGSSWYMYGGPNGYCVLCKTPWCKTCSAWDACETCVDGRWGDICEYDCSENCHGGVCNKTTGECVCKDQYFMGSNSMCQECPNNCETCTSAENCQTCVEGFYGSRCEHSCGSKCLECYGKASNCTKCRKLYAIRNNRCYPCPEGCRICYYSSRRGRAQCYEGSCLEGYYFSKAGDDYVFAKENDICRTCPTGCSSCNSESLCTSCYSGYFPFNSICCPDQCTTCLSGTECKTCPKGMYGKLCEKQCSEGCVSCSNGDYCNVCNNGRYSKSSEYTANQCECSVAECLSNDKDGTCLTCKGPGWYPYGNGCCPCNKYCVNGTCDSKGRCSACSTDTRHGQSCEHDCSTSIPFCKRCTSTSRLECIECETGTYLSNGACITCFSGCVDSACDHNGQCVNGCVDGWTGARCEHKCNAKCRRCDRYSAICSECIGGTEQYSSYYGDYCESACSQNCASGRCYITTGECHGICKMGYWGKTCETRCSDGCLGWCEKGDGSCSVCDMLRYGSNCSSTCNENCANPNNVSSVCRQVDGKCLFGCEVGFKGYTCSLASAEWQPTSSVPLIVGVAVIALVAIAVIVVVAILVCRKLGSPDDAYPSRGVGTSGNKTDGPVDPDTEQVRVPLTAPPPPPPPTTTTTAVG